MSCLVVIGCQDDPPSSTPPAGSTAASSTPAASTASAAASSSAPPASKPPHVVDLEAARGHTFAVYSNGVVKGWGSNEYGVLGLGKETRRLLRPQVIPGLDAVKEIRSGKSHSCALGRDGKVRCWGRNFAGCLGDGTLDSRRSPAPVVDLGKIRQIAVHESSSCAVGEDDSVWCWGFNGLSRTLYSKSDVYLEVMRRPLRIPEAPAARAVAMGNNQCLLTKDSTVACWGWITGGKCPDFHWDPCIAKTPVAVAALSDVVGLAVSGHLCALQRAGTVSCWGRGDFGQLGDGRFGRDYVQVKPVALPDLADISALDVGDEHSCAVRRNGTVLCWGHNHWGQLGVGDKKLRSKPTEVPGLSEVVSVALGTFHSCALRKDGRVLCWGGNQEGQLGNGESGAQATRLEPTEVKLEAPAD